MSRPLNLGDLNPQQREAVQTLSGPLLLLAGAGTGKTRVIIYRIAHLIASGVDPANILAVTFTNKAANEMRERIASLIPASQAEKLTIGTFHSFCLRILKRHIRRLGYMPNFSIATESYQIGLVRTIMTELGYTQGAMPVSGQIPTDAGSYLSAISRAKGALLTAADMAAEADNPTRQAIADVYGYYQRRLKNMNLVDFDDLLGLVVQLWQEHPDILENHRDLYRYIMIDEYQDTNAVQFHLMATLAGKTANICAVGDDDQSIYGWRGADISNILNYDRHFQGTRTIRLEQNYRSTETILRAANHVIALNRKRHPKTLWSNRETGKKIMAIRLETEQEEATLAAELLQERHLAGRRPYKHMAILYRSNHQSRTLEFALKRAKIPYRIVGGTSFCQRREILDAISLLNLLQNPTDDLSLLRVINVPPRGLGDKSIERLLELQRMTTLPLLELVKGEVFPKELHQATTDQLRSFTSCLEKYRKRFHEDPETLAQILSDFFNEVGYLDGLGRMYKPKEDALRRRENVFEFINAAEQYDVQNHRRGTLAGLLDSFALMDAADRVDKDADPADAGVTLMTVHASKGLEFPVVLVAGMEQGLFPHQSSLDENNLEEERRLFYVAATRAQDELILSNAGKRLVRGKSLKRRPSVFMYELPDELVEFCNSADALKPASAELADDFMAKMKAMFAPKDG